MDLVNNKLKDLKLTLMRTPYEKLGYIKKEWIDEIDISWRDKQTLILSIPSIIMYNGKYIENHIYNKVFDKCQLIKCENPNIMFRINTVEESKDYINNYEYNIKKIVAYSLEYETLGKIELYEDDQTYCLYKNINTNSPRNGIINKFLDSNNEWKIGETTEKALYEEIEDYIWYSYDFGTKDKINIQNGDMLWAKNLDINLYSDTSYIDLEIEYRNLKISDASGKTITNINSHITNVNKIHEGVSKIIAYYEKKDSEVANVKYVVTTKDGLVMTYYDKFPYSVGYNVSFGITFKYTNGKRGIIKKEKVRCFDNSKYKWIDFLRNDISDKFNVFIYFDTINKTINIYDIDEYGQNNGGIRLKAGVYYNHVDKKLISENIITKLIINNEECSIIDVNPIGQNYIYNFDHFIINEHMTDECKKSWFRYKDLVNKYSKELKILRRQLEKLNSNYIRLTSKIEALRYNIKLLETRLATVKKEQGSEQEINIIINEIKNAESELTKTIFELKKVNNSLDEINFKIKKYREMLTFENAEDEYGKVFDKYTLAEINSYICEDEVDDTTFVYGQDMYDYYTKLLSRKNEYPVSFNINLISFLDNIIIPDGVTWDFYIKEGNFLPIKEENYFVNNRKGLRIIGYKIKPKDIGNEIQEIKLSNNDSKDGDVVAGFAYNFKRIIKRTDNLISYKKTTKNKLKNLEDLIDFINNNVGNGNLDLSNITISN